MIPENVDHIALFDALNAWGWRDYVIEVACKFSQGYIAHLRSGKIKEMKYPAKARLMNFHEKNVPRGTGDSQRDVVAAVT